MVSTPFLILLCAAGFLLAWHVFVVIHLSPSKTDPIAEEPPLKTLDAVDREHQTVSSDLGNQVKELKDETDYKNGSEVDYEAERQNIAEQWEQINEAKERIGLK